MGLFLLFVVAPLVELFVIIQVGTQIGALNTIILLVLIAIFGCWLIKRMGIKVWNRFAQQVQAGQEPTKAIADGVCLLIAGALFVAPGFISDVVAVLLLLPPTRAMARGWLSRRKGIATARVIKATYGRRVDVVDTTATETPGPTRPPSRTELDP